MQAEAVDAFSPTQSPAVASCDVDPADDYDFRLLFYQFINGAEQRDITHYSLPVLVAKLEQCNSLYRTRYSKLDGHNSPIIAMQSLQLESPQVPGITSVESSILHSLPLQLTAPDWLQYGAQAVTGESRLASALLRLYLSLSGRVADHATLTEQLIAALQSCNIQFPLLHSREFSRQNNIADVVFEFAVLQLALGRHICHFLPEILGYSWAYSQSGILLEYTHTSAQIAQNPELARYCLRRARTLQNAVEQIGLIFACYIKQYPQLRQKVWQRLQSGFYLYQWQLINCSAHILPTLSPVEAMLHLIRDKAAVAAGYHHRVPWGDKTLQQWFAASPFDTQGFLSVLKQSQYFDAENPASSSLIALFDFHGPMFGVLTEQERIVLQQGLLVLTQASPVELNAPRIAARKYPKRRKTEQSVARVCKRQLFKQLLHAESEIEISQQARTLTASTLKTAKWRYRLPFKVYTHEALDAFAQSLYQRETAAYQPMKTRPRLSKASYVWGIEQLAPAILVDGCWLQHSHEIQHPGIRDLLLRIYVDEMGHGVWQQNHPYIYRQLLDSLGINIAALHSPDFIKHPGFLHSAFDIPVFLLSISKFPASFLPELLGLNLAIELSGLGKTYLQLAEELEYWGIDAKIVKLHMTIDNIVSGHAALALQAIRLYQDEMLALQGQQAVQHHWQRIYAGYAALQWVGLRFKYDMLFAYGCKQFTSNMRRTFTHGTTSKT